MDADDARAIVNLLRRGDYPPGLSQLEKRNLRQRATAFVCEKDDTGVVKLYHCGKAGKKHQLVICDAAQKREIMRTAHLDVSARIITNGAVWTPPPHNGVNVTIRKVNERYWWRRIVTDVRNFCMGCAECSRRFQTTSGGAPLALCERLLDNGGDDEQSSDGGGGHQLLCTVDETCEPNNASALLQLPQPLPPPLSSPRLLPVYITLQSPTYTCDLLSVFGELRGRLAFCDVVLASSDGTVQLHVHKVLLAAASGYLRSLLLDAPMSSSSLFGDFVVTLPGISGECLKCIVDYLYSGTLCITADSMSDIMVAATHLEIPSIVELCQNYVALADRLEDKKPLAVAAAAWDMKCGRVTEDKTAAVTGAVQLLEGVCEIVPDEDASDDDLFSNPTSAQPAGNTRRSARNMARNSNRLRQRATVSLSRQTKSKAKPSCKLADKPVKRLKISAVDKAALQKTYAGRGVRKLDLDLLKPNDSQCRTCDMGPKAVEKESGAETAITDSTSQPTSALLTVAACAIMKSEFPQNHNKKIESNGNVTLGTTRAIIRRRCRTSLLSWFLSRRLLRSSVAHLRVLMSFLSGRHNTGSPLSCRLCGSRQEFSLRSKLHAHYVRMHHGHINRFFHHHRRLVPNLLSPMLDSDCLNHPGTSLGPSISGRRHEVKRMAVAAAHCRPEDDSKIRTVTQIGGPMLNRCAWCAISFPSRADLIEHRQTAHHKPKKDMVVSTDPSAVPRRQVVIRDWSCLEEDCRAALGNEQMLREHMLAVHPSVVYSCPSCRFKTQLGPLLRRHVLRRHRERHNCPVCGKAYHVPFLLRIHMYNQHRIVDPQLKLYRCPHEGCDYTFPTKYGITQHLVKHAQTSAFTCHLCGQTFKRSLGLEKHLSKVHVTVRPYICDQCGTACADEQELKRHVLRHASNKPYSCEFCSFGSFKKASLKAHLFSRHQDKVDTSRSRRAVLRCDQCATFITDSRAAFDDHMRAHRNERDVPCPHCDKMFVRRTAMRQHVFRRHRHSSGSVLSVSPMKQC